MRFRAIATALNTFAFVLNIALNATFVFGLFGAPKLEATGVADQALQRILYGGYAPVSGMLYKALSSGDKSDNVGRLQERLYALGYLFEHREEADHHALALTLRSLLFGIREGVV